MPELNDWTYTGDMRPDPATMQRILAKIKELGLDPAKDHEAAAKIAMNLMDQRNTSVADYVWLPITFEGDVAKLYWQDSWKIED